ncbi:flagellar motor stator protein MotA [Marinococcus sp. PL1-022]|uniref:flagellar motor stator protein MotA n=1 Tax=Marinococcus sp. PL1-022 TaxID=3095363 RepID=UPI0029C1516D|nr:flagellar motor stator protein MotA [Marinococcus sp. PL1-022]MDX6151460.1 flagellar motor stator protein MotA [Marinococcus sp. PL1-022]
MDKASIIGIIIAFAAIMSGIAIKGMELISLLNPAALLIIFGGTIATVVIAFPGNELKNVPKLFGVLFKNQNEWSVAQLVPMFSKWAQTARKEGLLALEGDVQDIQDPFLRNGMTMAVDGQNSDFIRDIMSEELEAIESRHQTGVSIFTQAGTYAPTLGVLGAVVGLIAALADMSDIDKLGEAISAAFVATLLGIFTGYVLWHPFANKLKRKSKHEIHVRSVMIEGVLSVQEGQPPKTIEQKLLMYVPAKEREKIMEAAQEAEWKEGAENG